MILSKGKNDYKDNTFSFWDWSAVILQSPEEVISKVYELNLQGRVIKDIIAVGWGYNWSQDSLESAIWDAEKNNRSIPCYAEIDEPVLITFEDGDTLGISFDDGSSVRMELNTIPIDIKPGINPKNFHANQLFKSIIGKHIVAIEVTASTEYPDFTWSHGLELGKQSCYVSRLDIVVEDDAPHWRNRLKLSFNPFFDYGWVHLLDSMDQLFEIKIEEVPQILEGYITQADWQEIREENH